MYYSSSIWEFEELEDDIIDDISTEEKDEGQIFAIISLGFAILFLLFMAYLIYIGVMESDSDTDVDMIANTMLGIGLFSFVLLVVSFAKNEKSGVARIISIGINLMVIFLWGFALYYWFVGPF